VRGNKVVKHEREERRLLNMRGKKVVKHERKEGCYPVFAGTE
jgi:hypothetical protein